MVARPLTGCDSVKLVEFIVEPGIQLRVGRCTGVRLRFFLSYAPPAPADGGAADHQRGAHANEVRKEPREAVESLVERPCERLLRAVLRHEIRVHLVAALAS